MEGALVSAAAGALKPVVEKLGALLGDKYKRFMGVRTEIKSLTHELTAMEAFLKKMSEVEYPDEQDKIWMNKVRELSYDMEDSLNEFMLRVNHKSTKADSLLEKIKCSLGKMKTRSNIAKEIENLMKQVTLLGERNARYRTGEAISKTSNASVDPRALAIFKHTSKLVGIGEPKDELLKLLAEEDRFASTQQEVKVVSIVGCGGMGKTTLANRVYQELEGQYEHKAFISVSRNPDMMKILRTILSDISKTPYASTEVGDEQHLISKIFNFLADKRYFIVVDDIWKVEAWSVIRCAFPMTSRDSRIITTTRIKDVAKSCSSSNSHIYNIRPLSMVHSRELFHIRLFNPEEECPSHLEEVSSQILKKCDGLPLAIIALSGLLADKERTEDKWNQVKDSIGRALERNSSVEDMIQILSLSYFDLPHHLKACLLYLSIFPEDYTIDREELIRMWIAEGFIPIKNGHRTQESGQRCFNELVNRSLIQPVETDDIYNEVKSCRVHDIILDFIVCKAIEENFVTLVGVPEHTPRPQTTVRRLSLQGGNHRYSMVPADLEFSHVRSLHVFGHSTEIPSLKKFRHLRVVNFQQCDQLENHHLTNIGRLFQLRYLGIRSTKVAVLPEQIGYLRYLEMLDIRDTEVCELPTAIVRLGKLVHLLTSPYVKFPDGMAKMQALEILGSVVTSLQSCNFLHELGELKNLRKLILDVDDDFVGGDATGVERVKAIFSSLSKLSTHSLRSFHIWNYSILPDQGCPPPVSLRELIAGESPLQRIPNWIGSLVNRSSPLSDVCSDQPFRNNAKKRKVVKVSAAGGAEGPGDDGHSWRNYGQKDILGSKHPREYYRCNRRLSQGCLATKQVQRADEDPALFDVFYHGEHTCRPTASGGGGGGRRSPNQHNPHAHFPAYALTFSATSSPLSDICSGQTFRTNSKKRKATARWTSQVRVSAAGSAEGPCDDGHSWRKYGQKDILGSKHPRGYYHCTHRNSQGCPATKQVQRADEDPALFDVVYHGEHTCRPTAGGGGGRRSPNQHNPHTQSMLQSLSAGRTVDTDHNTLHYCRMGDYGGLLTPSTDGLHYCRMGDYWGLLTPSTDGLGTCQPGNVSGGMPPLTGGPSVSSGCD